MLYYLAEEFLARGGPAVFTYSTTRALLGFLSGLLISIVIGRPTIKWLFQQGYRDFPRNYGAISVSNKSGTPTMGGLLIWGTIVIVVGISMILQELGVFKYSLFSREETWIPLFTLVTCGLLGAIDDILNIKGIGKTKGLSAKLKLLWLTVICSPRTENGEEQRNDHK